MSAHEPLLEGASSIRYSWRVDRCATKDQYDLYVVRYECEGEDRKGDLKDSERGEATARRGAGVAPLRVVRSCYLTSEGRWVDYHPPHTIQPALSLSGIMLHALYSSKVLDTGEIARELERMAGDICTKVIMAANTETEAEQKEEESA